MYLGSTHRLQPIDIEPTGNTVSVSLEADNPFESAKDIEVYTQMSGGLTDPDPEMQSPDIITPIMPGAEGLFAISGLGNAPNPAQPQGPTVGQQIALAAVNTALNAGTSVFNNWLQNQQTKRDERLLSAQSRLQAEQAKIADAQARAAAAQAQVQAQALATQQSADRKKTITMLAIGGGILALGIIAILALRKKGGASG